MLSDNQESRKLYGVVKNQKVRSLHPINRRKIMNENLNPEAAMLRQLENANSCSIYGHPLTNDPGLKSFDKNWFPIVGCLCVQDSPENPYPRIDYPL